MRKPKLIILPGNGVLDFESTNWYGWLKRELIERGFEVVGETMPDPLLARKKVWLPQIKDVFGADESTVIVGHSSGAVATLRYLEENRLLGTILIGASYTDLGDVTEKLSGYYKSPWQWKKIKANAKWRVQFCSQDDPYIPIEEPRYIRDQIKSEYHEYEDRGHFGSPFDSLKEFPELLEVIERKLDGKG